MSRSLEASTDSLESLIVKYKLSNTNSGLLGLCGMFLLSEDPCAMLVEYL